MGIRASQEVQKAINEQAGRIEERLTAIRKDVTNVGLPVREAISRHPARALAIGVGAGVTLGILMAKSLRSQADEDEPAESTDSNAPRPRLTGRFVQLLMPLLMEYGFKYLTRDRS